MRTTARRLTPALLPLVLVLTAATACGGSTDASASASATSAAADATVTTETLTTGNELAVYVPGGGTTGYRAASTPILLALADPGLTADAARSTAESSGLAEIAAREQGVVAFLAPAGDAWAATDTAGVTAALARFGDTTGDPYDDAGTLCSTNGLTGEEQCLYPGTASRVYVFADGDAADFVSAHLTPGFPVSTAYPAYDGTPVQQLWTPAAVWLADATDPAVAPDADVEVPAYLVNATAAVEASYRALNATGGLVGAATVDGTAGLDRTTLLAGYDEVVGRAIQRVSEVVDHRQSYAIPDYAAEGITVTHTSVDVDGTATEYYEYRPDTVADADVPLVMVFHGGGSDAEVQMWATGWPEVARENGFVVVAVERHVERTAADMVGLLDQLLAADPSLDADRVYASGFSMGSIKSWDLGDGYPARFAAIAPTDGSAAPEVAGEGVVPTIYFAGLQTPLAELPHQEYLEFAASGEANDIDARLAQLLARNGVTDAYTYSAAADPVWGIAPDATTTATDTTFGVTATVSAYASDDGVTYTALVADDGASHEPLAIHARVAWAFMAQYSRTADGGVAVAGGDLDLAALAG